MKFDNLGEFSTTAVSVMRKGDSFGATAQELLDGNTIPRLCMAVGSGACANECKIAEVNEYQPKVCAEENISVLAEKFGVNLDSLVVAAATHDNVVFGDSINEAGAELPEEGLYQKVPATNAFFFRPLQDRNLNNEPMRAVAMRMADCGSVMFEFKDKNGDLVLGQSHFSRTNMRGPSAYEERHKLSEEKVSWAEYVIGNAIEHYGAKTEHINIKLVAGVEGKDFIHHYKDLESMNNHYPGWQELGFLHPEDGRTKDFDCLIDYREMIEWQLTKAVNRFGLNPKKVITEGAINTGDISLGHSSHHWASEPKSKIAHGRDMYIIGLSDLDVEIKNYTESISLALDSAESFFSGASFEDADEAWERVRDYQSRTEELKKIKNNRVKNCQNS